MAIDVGVLLPRRIFFSFGILDPTRVVSAVQSLVRSVATSHLPVHRIVANANDGPAARLVKSNLGLIGAPIDVNRGVIRIQGALFNCDPVGDPSVVETD